jgi:uncharacterized protein (TIGR02266 family)
MADIEQHEKRRHFRGKARKGHRVHLAYWRRESDAPDPVYAVTRNLGIGGAFIQTDEPHPEGTQLQISLQLPNADEAIEVVGEVRWVMAPGDGPVESGMGVRFVDLGVEARLQLSEYFASLTGVDPDGTDDDGDAGDAGDDDGNDDQGGGGGSA